MGALPSKRSPPDGLLRRPVRQERAACRQPNGGRVLSRAEPAPPCRTHPAAGIANHLTASTAFAAAALVGAENGRLRSQTAIQAVWNASPHGYTPPNRRRVPEADCAALRDAFFLSKPARRAKRGRRPIQPSMRALLPPMRRAGFAALSRPTARQADTARVYAAEPPLRPRSGLRRRRKQCRQQARRRRENKTCFRFTSSFLGLKW